MEDHRVEAEVLGNLLLHTSELVSVFPSHEYAICGAAVLAGADEAVRLPERPLQPIECIYNLFSLNHFWVLQHP